MTELDPIRFKDNLGATLARYITTAASVSAARAPRLSRAVAVHSSRACQTSRRAAALKNWRAMGHCTVLGRHSPKAKRGNPSGVGGFTYTSPQQ